jgi:cell division protein DivIC
MKLPFRIPLFIQQIPAGTVGFVVWMFFFDRNDPGLCSGSAERTGSPGAEQSLFTEQIAEERRFSEDLKKNPAAIEKFAREQYKMKRDGEDLFLINRPEPEENE